MKKGILMIYFFIILCSLSACQKTKVETSEPKEDNLNYKKNISVFYSPFENHLYYYDEVDHKIKFYDARENTFQYSFTTPCQYFTTGNSTYNGFQIIEVKENQIQPIYAVKEKDKAIFPLAEADGRYFFVLADYGKDTPDENEICELVNGQLVKFVHSKDHVYTNGAVLGGKLYYLVYEEQKGGYSVYCLDINSYEAKPKKVMEYIPKGAIYAINDDIYYEKDDRLVGMHSKASFPSGVNIEYSPKDHLLFRLDIPKENKSFLKLTIVQTKTQKEVYVTQNVLGYRLEKDDIYIYKPDGISLVRLNSLGK